MTSILSGKSRHSRLEKRSSLWAKEQQIIPENESDAEQRERLKKKARKMMYNENGVAYAPWVTRQIDEDAIINDLIKKETQKKWRQ